MLLNCTYKWRVYNNVIISKTGMELPYNQAFSKIYNRINQYNKQVYIQLQVIFTNSSSIRYYGKLCDAYQSL